MSFPELHCPFSSVKKDKTCFIHSKIRHITKKTHNLVNRFLETFNI